MDSKNVIAAIALSSAVIVLYSLFFIGYLQIIILGQIMLKQLLGQFPFS